MIANAFMPTRNVNLTEHLERFIKHGVVSGRFSNASEVVREGLQLLERRQQEDKAKLKWLGAAVREGIEDIEGGHYTTLRSAREISMKTPNFRVCVNRGISWSSASRRVRSRYCESCMMPGKWNCIVPKNFARCPRISSAAGGASIVPR